MNELTREEVLAEQQRLRRPENKQEKKRIERKEAVKLNSNVNASYGSFILDDDALPQQINHAVGTLEINNKCVRYYGIKLPQQTIKFDKKTKEEYSSIKETSCILTEEGEIFNEIEKPEGTNFQFSSEMGLKNNRITLQTIRAFIEQKHETPTFKEVFEEITKGYQEAMVFEREEWYELNAIWDMCTYYHDLIDKFLIIKHEGESGTAKSKAMHLSAQYAFNGKSFLKLNPANFFRYRHHNKAMLCIEEAEQLFDTSRNKQGGDSELVEYLNGSYEKGNVVPRQNDKDLNKTEEFDPCGFTRIGAIKPLKGALEKRSITLTMIRAKQNDKRGELEIEKNPNTPKYQQVRDKLYLLGLTRYRVFDKAQKEIQNTFNLHNRQWLISKPILAMTNCIDEALTKKIGSFLKYLFDVRDSSQDESSWEILLANALLKKYVQSKESFFISNEELLNMFKEELNKKQGEESFNKISSKAVTTLLEKLSLKEYKGHNSAKTERGFTLSFLKLAEILIRNDKRTIQDILKNVSEVSIRPFTDEEIGKWYTDTFTDTLNKCPIFTDTSDGQDTLYRPPYVFFNGFNEELIFKTLRLFTAKNKGKHMPTNDLEKYFERGFDSWFSSKLKEGSLFEPKKGFVGVLE